MNIQLENYSVNTTSHFSEQKEWIDIINENRYSSIFILADENTFQYCYPKIKNFIPSHQLLLIKSGENEKNIETCNFLWSLLTEHKAERNSLLINLGGGVIGDMGGFVASTYKRGFDFINIPTTLLSQVDASVGGKLGIDFNGIKNLIGVFNDPQAVLICTEFLNTLPFEQLRSGFAEILKHGLIFDKDYWEMASQIDLPNFNDWVSVIQRSILIKKTVVQNDPFEKGMRKILNFGHTIGHALETWSLKNDKSPLLHGEAITIGMICESWLSNRVHHLKEDEMYQISETLFKFFKKYETENIPFEALINFMRSDKKNTDGDIMFSLLNSTGSCNYNIKASDELIEESLTFYKALK